MDTDSPDAIVYYHSTTHGIPAHRLEYGQSSKYLAPPAPQVIRNLAIEIFTKWAGLFAAMGESVVHALVKQGK